MSDTARDAYRAAIGAAIGIAADRVALFARGRVALFALLRAMDVGRGDEVILPAFTCVAVPNAVLYAGARPVFVDIDPTTYLIDPVAVEDASTPRTRVIIAQNAFGLSADLQSLEKVAQEHGAVVLDDCAHGLGGTYRGQPNGSTAAASFFSTQWSKPISTGLGGFAVARDPETARRLREVEMAAREPSAFRTSALQALVVGRERAGAGAVFRAGRSAYRGLGRLGIVPASSGRDELDGSAIPDGFLCRLSDAQARLGCERLARLRADVDRRRAVALRYSGWLTSNGRTAAAEPPYADHAFLRYPLRVEDRRAFHVAAERAGIDVGDWFVSPLHPVTDHLERWGYEAGSAPMAEGVCRQIVNLPTDPNLGDREVGRVLAFLDRTIDLII